MSFVGEIKRRKIFQVAAVYLVVAWLIMQVVDVVNEPLRLPEWFATVAILLLAIGFPIALITTWAFEITPEGVLRDAGGDMPGRAGNRNLEWVLIGLLILAIGFIFVDNYVLEDSPDTELVADEPVETLPPALVEEPPDVLPNSVAVLPFENVSPDPDDAYFATGIHEEILNQLTKIRDLNVIARTSVLPYPGSGKSIPQIAGELNVETVMEGSVRRAGDAVRVTAQLVDGMTNTHLWSEVYDGDLTDIFAIQAEIAERIAMALEAELSPAEQQRLGTESTVSGEAVALYLRAKSSISESTESRLQYLSDAIRHDPQFARAYAERAFLEANVLGADPSADAELEERISSDIETALRLDPGLGYALVAQAYVHWFRGRVSESRATYEQALALAPNDTEIMDRYAGFLVFFVGDFAEGVRLLRRGISLDPSNPDLYDALGDAMRSTGDFDAAAVAYRRAIDLGDRTPGSHVGLGLAELLRGDNEEALAYFRLSEYLMPEQLRPNLAPTLAYGYANLGRGADLDRVINETLQNPDLRPSHRALLSLAEGDYEAVLDHLNEEIEEAVLRPNPFLDLSGTILQSNVIGDPILEQPEFLEVRSRLGFRE